MSDAPQDSPERIWQDALAVMPADSWALLAQAALARTHLDWFAWFTMRTTDGKPLEIEPYQTRWARLAERAEREGGARYIITAPPRHAKSTWWSVAFAAWYLGLHPDRTALLVGNSLDTVAPLSKAVRGLVQSNRAYPLVFPGVAIDDRLGDAVTHWYIRQPASVGGKDPSFICAGLGGSITGRGAHLIIVDDPVKHPQEVATAYQRDKAERDFMEVVYSRRQPGASVVVIGTRWHQDDLLGRLADKPDWKLIEFPAIRTDDEGVEHALWPSAWPLEALHHARDTIGSRSFSCQYQGNPLPAEGGIVKPEWLQRRFGRDVPEPVLVYRGVRDEQTGEWSLQELSEQERQAAQEQGKPVVADIVQAWDVAAMVAVTNDYSACATVGMDAEGRKYVLDCWWGRAIAPDLERLMLEYYRKWQPMSVVVEKASSGIAIVQSIQSRTGLPFRFVEAVGKGVLLEAVSPSFERGEVYFPLTGPDMPTSKREGSLGRMPWPDALCDLVAGFPAAEVDDPVDALAYALLRLERMNRPINI